MGGGASKKKKEQMTANMLLLGAPSVGKSTIFRQMKLLYRDGFTDEERKRSRIELRRNLISSLLKLDEVALNEGLNLSSNDAEEAITKLKLILSDYEYDERDDENCVEAQQEGQASGEGAPSSEVEDLAFPEEDIKVVFSDPSIQQALQVVLNPDYKVPESDAPGRELIQTALPYVMEHFDRIIRTDYVPSDKDCLHLRRHTTNVERIQFDCELDIQSRKEVVLCTCTDIGGQAQEQEKWEMHASNVDFLVFVAAMSDFDRVLPDGTNSLEQQFRLLTNVFEASCFGTANVIVLLNKSDALEEKLKHHRLTDYFPEFIGENTTADAEQYFQEKCDLLLKTAQEKMEKEKGMKKNNRQVQILSTCALDSQMVNKVLTTALAASLCSTLMNFGLIG